MKNLHFFYKKIHKVYGRGVGSLKCLFTTRPISQKHKIDELLKEKKFRLIILDACRFDYFRKEYADFISGNLEKVWSEGRNTFEYAKKYLGWIL